MKEALRQRRIAINERKRQVEEAWKNWEKPIVKPGDLVIALRPSVPLQEELPNRTLLTASDRKSRLCLVYRFWSENEERCGQ